MNDLMKAKREWLETHKGRHTREAISPKNKALLMADLTIRSEAVGGGDVPEDEVQLDFTISDNQEDAHGSFMTDTTLRNYAEDAQAGVPFMVDHSSGLARQIGRTIRGEHSESDKNVISTMSMLRDSEETPENMKVNEYIRRIERRYYTSVSVGFRDADEICNICDKPIFDWMRENPCEHIPKRTYDGVRCTYRVDNARLREVSLVSAGSNPNAKLLDTREWTEDLRNVKKEGDIGGGAPQSQKTLLERDGEKYRKALIDKAIEEGVRAEGSEFNENEWRERFKTRESGEIIQQTAIWVKLGDAIWGEGGRKTESGGSNGSPQRGQGISIVLPDYLFEY